MRKSFACKVCVAGALTWLVLFTATPSTPAAFKKVTIGEKAPSFALTDLEGKERGSKAILADGVSVIIFWATWSPRSLEMLRDLELFRKEVEGHSFQVVAINAEHSEISHSDKELIKSKVKESGSTALVLLDQGLTAFNDFGTIAYPSSLITDSSGKVVFTMAGYPTTMRTDLTDSIKEALGIVDKKDKAAVEEYVPKNRALMYYNLGKRLYEKGQEEKAEAQLLLSVERDPDFVKPRRLLGIYYKKTGRHEDALKEFSLLKELDPRDNEAGYQAAAITLQSKKYADAEGLFKELTTEYPEREEFALGLALSHKYQGHEEDYRTIREKSADLYPAEARFCYEMAGVAESAEDLEEAAVLYRAAIERAFAESKRP